MTILFDARWVGDHGIGRFARELSERLPPMHSVGQFPLLHPLEPLWLSYAARFKQHSVYFSPGFNPPFIAFCPVVFTIHDLIHLEFTAEETLGKTLYYKLLVRQAARRAYKVLTVSQYSKAAICRWANIPENCVEVVYNGCSKAFVLNGCDEQLQKPYIVYVGNQKPHKNIPRLLQAFSQLQRTEVKLYMSGEATLETQICIKNLDLQARVQFLGRLDDEQLAVVYRGALCLALPSLYEGFGLPALEAMACGTPVLTSNTTSLPEVVGEAAILVNPLSIREIAVGLQRLISDEELRIDLRMKGLEQAHKFDWDITANKVRRVLEDAALGRDTHKGKT